MKLIDGEKVEEEINECVWDAYGSNEDEMGNAYCIARGIIENAPSVNAIPIEFIEEQIKKHKEAEEWAFNVLGETDYWSVALEILIEEWRRKSESD